MTAKNETARLGVSTIKRENLFSDCLAFPGALFYGKWLNKCKSPSAVAKFFMIGIAIKIPSQSPPENQNKSVPTYMSHQGGHVCRHTFESSALASKGKPRS